MWWNFESLFGPPYLKLLATTHMFLSSLHNPHIALQPASLLSDFSSFLKQLISGWLQYVRRPSADQRFLRWQLKDVNFLIFVSGQFVNFCLSSYRASTFLTTADDAQTCPCCWIECQWKFKTRWNRTRATHKIRSHLTVAKWNFSGDINSSWSKW